MNITAYHIFPTASAGVRVAARRSAQTTLGLDKALSMIARRMEVGKILQGVIPGDLEHWIKTMLELSAEDREDHSNDIRITP